MGERYGASITASPTMKVLYFRAVTRNLAPTDTRLTRDPVQSNRFHDETTMNIVFHM